MKKLFYCIFILFCACGINNDLEEEIIPNRFIPQNCIVDLKNAQESEENCRPTRFENCLSIEEVERLYTFNDSSRIYLPWSCLEIGERIFYENEIGDITYFSIISKEHILTKNWFFWETCATLPNYCFNIEDYSIKLVSEDRKYELSLSLSMWVRGRDGDFRKSDRLNVTEYDLENSNSTSIFLLGLEGNFIAPSSIEQFDESTIVFGDIFENIHYMSDTWNANKVDEKFYNNILYNKRYGIVSFTDKNGDKWKILN